MNRFVPEPGQTDYTNIREAPVINCAVVHRDKILIVKRSPDMNFYPGLWNGISGFLDDAKNEVEKARQEIKEELGLGPEHILRIEPGPVFEQEDKRYGKVWLVHCIRVEIDTDKPELNWEAQEYRWVGLDELPNYELVPGFEHVARAVCKNP